MIRRSSSQLDLQPRDHGVFPKATMHVVRHVAAVANPNLEQRFTLVWDISWHIYSFHLPIP